MKKLFNAAKELAIGAIVIFALLASYGLTKNSGAFPSADASEVEKQADNERQLAALCGAKWPDGPRHAAAKRRACKTD